MPKNIVVGSVPGARTPLRYKAIRLDLGLGHGDFATTQRRRFSPSIRGTRVNAITASEDLQ